MLNLLLFKTKEYLYFFFLVFERFSGGPQDSHFLEEAKIAKYSQYFD